MAKLTHVAIIPDGNRRWARAQGLPGTAGHAAAVTRDRLLGLLTEAKKLKISHLTIWGFSTENWKRSQAEIDGLFGILRESIERLRPDAHREGVRFRWLGRRDRIPQTLREELEAFEKETAGNSDIHFQLCLDYGGRDEILRAVNLAIAEGEAVDETKFTGLLDTAGMPDPDLIIRTSGEQRLSGLFPWQGTYAEIYFVQRHFPDFTPSDLRDAAEWFSSRERRYGGA